MRLCFLFLFFCLNLFSQEIPINFFNEEILKQKSDLDMEPGYNMYLQREIIYAANNSGFYVVSYSHNTNKPSIEIEGFDVNLKRISNTKYTPSVNKKKAYVIGAFNFNNNPYVLLGQVTPSEKKLGIYANPINSKGEVLDEPKLIETFKSDEDEGGGLALKALSMKNWIGVDKQNFNTIVSENKEYIGLFYRIGSLGAKGCQVNLLIIDNKFNKWSKLYNLDLNYIDFLNEGYAISNDGQFIYNYSEKKQKDKMGIPLTKVQYGLYLSKTMDKEIKYNDLFGKKFVYETKARFDKNNDLSYFYSFRKGSNDDEIEGFGIASIDKSKFTVSSKKESILDKKLMTKYGKKYFEVEYKVKNYFITDDNEKYIVFENYKTRGLFSSMYKTHTNFLNAEEVGKIAVMKLNNQNQLLGIKELKKESFIENMNDFRGAYSYLENNKLNILFNTVADNPKDAKDLEKYTIGVKYTFSDLNGDSSKFYSVDKSKNVIHPYSLRPLYNNVFFGESSSNNNKKCNYVLLNYSELKALEKTNSQANTNTNTTSSTPSSTPSISNSSAIANGASSSSSSAPVAKILKHKADEKQVEYYKSLREKFAAEEKIRLEKEAKENAEKAKKEEEARQARHLNPEQAPQFDKYRNGAKNEPVVKKTPEEEYNSLFK